MNMHSSSSSGGEVILVSPPLINSEEKSHSSKSSKKQVSPAKKWFFTWNNYKPSDIEDIQTRCKENNVKYVFQEEEGDSKTPHLQGCIEFPTKQRPMSLFWNTKSIHWESCKDWKASVKYCTKTQGRIGGPYANIAWPKPIRSGMEGKELRPWQKQVMEIIKGEPDERSIYWFWDAPGNKGKTIFCRELIINHMARYVSGQGKNIKFAIQKAIENEKPVDIVLFDFPRTTEGYISYAGLESVKSAVFFNEKYEADQCIYNWPHVICFANFRPDTSAMSADRWNIFEIQGDFTTVKE